MYITSNLLKSSKIRGGGGDVEILLEKSGRSGRVVSEGKQ